MANRRWAELLIMKVQKDKDGRIQKVKVAIDTIDSFKGDVILTKDEIILLIKNQVIIKTIYVNDEPNKYSEGSVVSYYKEYNGEEYLRTQSNKTDKDNLDNLPIF